MLTLNVSSSSSHLIALDAQAYSTQYTSADCIGSPSGNGAYTDLATCVLEQNGTVSVEALCSTGSKLPIGSDSVVFRLERVTLLVNMYLYLYI